MIDKKEFDYVVRIINNSRERALRQVNKELIEMYRAIGKFLSEKASLWNIWRKWNCVTSGDTIKLDKSSIINI